MRCGTPTLPHNIVGEGILLIFNMSHIINSNYTIMTTHFLENYLAPVVEVMEFNVEEGFLGSNLENIGGEREEQDW